MQRAFQGTTRPSLLSAPLPHELNSQPRERTGAGGTQRQEKGRTLLLIGLPRTGVNKCERKAGDSRGGPQHVVYMWVTSSPFSVGTRHMPFSILEGFKVMQSYGHMADALPPSPAHNSHREK